MKTVKNNCNGDDLLNQFKNFNIELGNINPNVIKAWFDTDDADTLNLLNWLCNSLSTKNYLSAQEEIEFNNIEAPLYGKEYENALEIVQNEYPDIFDVDCNKIVIDGLQSEIEMLEEELLNCEEIIKQKENLNQSLSKELTKLVKYEENSVKSLDNIQEECERKAEELETINNKIYNQIENYSNIFQNYEFAAVPNFFSSIELQEYEDKFQDCFFRLKSVTQYYKDQENEEVFLNDTVNINESTLNTLNLMKSRLYESYKQYIIEKSKEEKLKKVLCYINNCTVDSVISLVESVYLQLNMESKNEQFENLVEIICRKFSEINIIKPKLILATNDLKLYESKLNCLTNILDTVTKILAMTFTISVLYKLEQKSITSTDEFLINVVNYTAKDLQNYFLRTKKMQDIISEYDSYLNRLDFRENYRLIYAIMDIIKISNVDEYNLNYALDIFSQFQSEIKNLIETPLKTDDFNRQCLEIRKNINTLQKFLISGPTNCIVVIPQEFQNIFNELEAVAKKQDDLLKSSIELCNKKVKLNKWEVYKRHLWMYFLRNPQKVLLIIKEIEDFYNQQQKD